MYPELVPENMFDPGATAEGMFDDDMMVPAVTQAATGIPEVVMAPMVGY